jgi:hypothetical protein
MIGIDLKLRVKIQKISQVYLIYNSIKENKTFS